MSWDMSRDKSSVDKSSFRSEVAEETEKAKKSFFYRLKSRYDQRKAPDIDSDIVARNRYCTDVIGIVFLFSLLLILFGLVLYCVSYGDIHRVKNGFDSCGYVCGKPKPKKKPLPHQENPLEKRSNEYGPICTPNNEDKKFLLYQKSDFIITKAEHVIKTCVSKCYEGFEAFGNKCIPMVGTDVANTIFSITGHENFFKEINEDLCSAWVFLCCLACITTVLALVGLTILRFFALTTIWIILLGLLLNAIGASAYSWFKWYDLHQEEHPSDAHKKLYNTFLIGGLTSTTTMVNITLLVYTLKARISLIAELYREAGRSVTDMPLLFCIPLLTFCALCMVSAMWLYFSIWIESSGHFTVEGTRSYYRKDLVIHTARWLNIFVAMWLIFLIVGCQDVIVACSVAQWYFIRNKSELKSPIRRSAFYLFRYHLGSVAMFSVCTTTFRILRAALKKFEFALMSPKNQYVRPLFNCCDCCLLFFEKYLALMSRNAYIEMSLHGKNFVISGKEAFLLVVNNRWTMQAISATGDYVLFFLKILTVFPSTVIGIFIYESIRGINHIWILVLLTGFLSYSVAHCFISVFEMVIDSLFICYCYDTKWNDGKERPYFMTRNLLAFVEHSVLVAAQEGFLDLEFEEP